MKKYDPVYVVVGLDGERELEYSKNVACEILHD